MRWTGTGFAVETTKVGQTRRATSSHFNCVSPFRKFSRSFKKHQRSEPGSISQSGMAIGPSLPMLDSECDTDSVTTFPAASSGWCNKASALPRYQNPFDSELPVSVKSFLYKIAKSCCYLKKEFSMCRTFTQYLHALIGVPPEYGGAA
jgi:hypothetical protein